MKRREFLYGLGAGAVGLMVGGCDFSLPFMGNDEAENSDATNSFQGSVEYRPIPHSGENVSTIAIGASALHDMSLRQRTLNG